MKKVILLSVFLSVLGVSIEANASLPNTGPTICPSTGWIGWNQYMDINSACDVFMSADTFTQAQKESDQSCKAAYGQSSSAQYKGLDVHSMWYIWDPWGTQVCEYTYKYCCNVSMPKMP